MATLKTLIPKIRLRMEDYLSLMGIIKNYNKNRLYSKAEEIKLKKAVISSFKK